MRRQTGVCRYWRLAGTAGACCFLFPISTFFCYSKTKKSKRSSGPLFPNFRALCGIWDSVSVARVARLMNASASKKTMRSFIWRCWIAGFFRATRIFSTSWTNACFRRPKNSHGHFCFRSFIGSRRNGWPATGIRFSIWNLTSRKRREACAIIRRRSGSGKFWGTGPTCEAQPRRMKKWRRTPLSSRAQFDACCITKMRAMTTR